MNNIITKEIKSELCKFIKKVNSKNTLRNELTKQMSKDLEILIKLWNEKNKDLKHYFKMDKYHENLNIYLWHGNKELMKLWKNYINKYEYIKSLKYYVLTNCIPTKNDIIKSNDIINFIKKEFPRWNFDCGICEDHTTLKDERLLKVIINCKVLSLKFNFSVNKIKNLISNAIKGPINMDNFKCFICNNSKSYKIQYNCCIKPACFDCYLSSFLENQGIIKCPKCGHKEGFKARNEVVVIGAAEILDKAQCKLESINNWNKEDKINEKIKRLTQIFNNKVEFKYHKPYDRIYAHNEYFDCGLPREDSYMECVRTINMYIFGMAHLMANKLNKNN